MRWSKCFVENLMFTESNNKGTKGRWQMRLEQQIQKKYRKEITKKIEQKSNLESIKHWKNKEKQL